MGEAYSYEELEENGQRAERCECCGVQTNRKNLPLSCELHLLGHLGSGYPLYFQFLKFSFSILFMMFISSAVFNLASNILGDNCLTTE